MKRRTVRGVAWAGVGGAGSRAIGFALFLVLARLLEPAAFGTLALAGVFVALAQVLLDQGFADAIVQRDELEEGHLASAFWLQIAAGAGLSALVVAGAPALARAFGQADVAPVLRLLTVMLLVGSTAGVPQALLRRRLAFDVLARASLLSTAAGGVAGIAAAVAGLGVYALVVQQLTAACLGAVLYWRSVDWRPSGLPSRRCLGDLVSFGAYVTGTNLVGIAGRRSDDLFVGAVLGPAALGIYSLAYRVLTTLTTLVPHTVAGVAFPALSSVRREPDRLRALFHTAVRLTALVTLPAFAGVALLAGPLVTGLFGAKWAGAVPVLRILALLGALQSVLFLTDTLLLTVGRPAWVFRLKLAAAVLNVVALAVAVRYGIVAVAAAVTVRAILVAPAGVWCASRAAGIRTAALLAELRVPAAASAVSAGLVALAGSALSAGAWPPLVALAAGLSLGGAAYAGLVRVLSPPLFAEFVGLLRHAAPGGRGDDRVLDDARPL